VTRQFAGFLVAGGIAAAANVGSRILFSRLVGLELAVILAYLVGMTVAFVLMRAAVFPPSAAPIARQVALFGPFGYFVHGGPVLIAGHGE